MLQDGDLEAAVAAGIVSEAQAALLRELARARERERAIALGHEERFRFMRGFNDIFFAIGVILFVGGFAYFTVRLPGGLLLNAAIVWALAELLVARLRLALPAIILAALFVGFAFLAVPIESWLGLDVARPNHATLRGSLLYALGSEPGAALIVALRGLLAAAAAGAFYARFRVPYALLPLATSLVFVALAAVSKLVPAAKIWDPIALLVCGLAVFAAAMSFDASDRERLSRRADCAFWLHLLAAPLIVHSLIWLVSPWLAPTPSAPGPYAINMTPPLAAAVVVIFVALAAVAILIDRRALLVSGLTYLGGAVGFAISSAKAAPGDGSFVFAATLALLGALVLALGVGWMPLRQRLISLFSASFARLLPPVPARS